MRLLCSNLLPAGVSNRLSDRLLSRAINEENDSDDTGNTRYLVKEIRMLEDHARACRSGDELQVVLVTREEADVIESFRRFKFQDYD